MVVIKALEFIFQDFWHWLGFAVLLALFTFWTPISIQNRKKD